MGPRVDNNTELWQAKINRFQRLSAAYIATAIAASGSVQLISSFTIGDGNPDTPANGTTEYANPLVVGNIQVYKNGTGYLIEGTNFDLIAGGGFELLGGSVFSTDETYKVFKTLS